MNTVVQALNVDKYKGYNQKGPIADNSINID